MLDGFLWLWLKTNCVDLLNSRGSPQHPNFLDYVLTNMAEIEAHVLLGKAGNAEFIQA